MASPACTTSRPCRSTGKPAQLASQRGKVLLIVNTASQPVRLHAAVRRPGAAVEGLPATAASW